jgi:hypothetical protein
MRLNTRAFAIAGGALTSALVFGLTFLFLLGPGDPTTLRPLSGLLFGYHVSVAGAFVGAMWGYVYGWLGGGALAFVYNLALVPPPPLELESGSAEPGSEAA